jgi:hypothetical protein
MIRGTLQRGSNVYEKLAEGGAAAIITVLLCCEDEHLNARIDGDI